MNSTSNIPIILSDGTMIYIQTTVVKGEASISEAEPQKFKDALNSIKAIANEMNELINEVKPKGAEIEFGVEIGFEPGKLTTLLVKGSMSGNMKVTLKW